MDAQFFENVDVIEQSMNIFVKNFVDWKQSNKKIVVEDRMDQHLRQKHDKSGMGYFLLSLDCNNAYYYAGPNYYLLCNYFRWLYSYVRFDELISILKKNEVGFNHDDLMNEWINQFDWCLFLHTNKKLVYHFAINFLKTNE